MPRIELFDHLVGCWSGICRTWFEPDKLADESAIRGEFQGLLGGRFLRHVYDGTIQGKPRHGEETIAFNTITQQYQVVWIDDFHMSEAILFSQGPAIERGFNVFGNYDVGNGHPPWGWRTELQWLDSQHLQLASYNVMPDGAEAKAVEIQYRRV